MQLPVPAWLTLAALASSVGFAQNGELVIAGVVHDAVTGASIASVDLALSTSRRLTHYQTLGKTDSFGNFRFEKIAAGLYQLRLMKNGYAGSNYGDGKSERIKAGPGVKSEELSFQLTPTAMIQGRVLDALDKPIAGAYLYAEREGKGSFPAVSEKDGSYRFENVPPGAYRISARVPYPTRKAMIERDPETGAIRGYPNNQYYPGVDDSALAGVVAITGGERLENFDIRLRPALLVELSGQVIDAVTREPLTSGEVELSPIAGGLTDQTYVRRRLEGDTAGFRFDLLRPGSYAVLVYRDHAKSSSPYAQTVEIGSGDRKDLRISVPAFGSLSGKLLVPEKAKARAPFTIRFFSAHTPTREVVAGADGSFSLDNMPPGRWSTFVSWSNFGDPRGPKDLYVASIRQNGPTGFVTVGEGASAPVEIELSDQVGQLSGMVIDDNQQPVPDALVVLPGETWQNRVTANAEGGFNAKLPPGSYSVTAWDGGMERASLPADLMRVCGDRLTKVKITVGESSFIRVEVCRP